jgi:3',5'-cyclic AMP phosphodiesterase CpdA
MLTIVHGSDLHFGRFHDAGVAEAFLSSAETIAPDMIVLSGDFTQRAKVQEYEEARRYLRRLPGVPLVLTPGNHDVPLYRVFERILFPYANYRKYVQADLDVVTRIPGATVVSLSSVAPLRAIVNGRITDQQLDLAREVFREAPAEDIKIVVAHHNLAPAPDYEGDHPLPRAQSILGAFHSMGVQLVLGGHLHRSCIGNSLDVAPGLGADRGIVIVQCGTTASKRGRAREKAKNSFNAIRLFGGRLEVTHHLYFGEQHTFLPISTHTFPVVPDPWLRPGPALEGSQGEHP